MWKREGVTHLEENNSLAAKKGVKLLHVSTRIFRKTILQDLESLNIIRQVLQQIQEDHQPKRSVFPFISELPRTSNTFWKLQLMHVFYIRENHHCYKYWYVATILLNLISYFISIFVIFGVFGHVTYFACKSNYSITHT